MSQLSSDSRFQISLTSLLVLVIVEGWLLYLNVRIPCLSSPTRIFGWPFEATFEIVDANPYFSTPENIVFPIIGNFLFAVFFGIFVLLVMRWLGFSARDQRFRLRRNLAGVFIASYLVAWLLTSEIGTWVTSNYLERRIYSFGGSVKRLSSTEFLLPAERVAFEPDGVKFYAICPFVVKARTIDTRFGNDLWHEYYFWFGGEPLEFCSIQIGRHRK